MRSPTVSQPTIVATMTKCEFSPFGLVLDLCVGNSQTRVVLPVSLSFLCIAIRMAAKMRKQTHLAAKDVLLAEHLTQFLSEPKQ